MFGLTDIAKLLLSKGADVNAEPNWVCKALPFEHGRPVHQAQPQLTQHNTQCLSTLHFQFVHHVLLITC